MSYTFLHLTYASWQDRLDLIRHRLPRIAADERFRRRWWFVDVPNGLEVGVLYSPGDAMIRRDLEGLLPAATFVDQPMVLDPQFFFGEPPPPFYIEALADDSARAAVILADGDRLSDDDVRAEIGAIHARLIPNVDDRLRALELHAVWLDGGASSVAGASRLAMYVARLAHTQAVRLLGPQDTRDDLREAALVRTLVTSLST